MTDPQNPQEKMAAAGAGTAGSMHAAGHESKAAFERLVDRLSDSISEMAHHSRDAAVEAEKLLEQKTHKIAATAEHQIHCAPFKSILIAAGAGAAVATLVSWLVRSRPH
ncbi:hypothetical protein [Limnohabitans sp. Rim47]|uniref:hypothetical protein n=1 Tax=Limnohabitans sp. Rim47 TaxID=1100721 RepID=UPI0002F440DE|nr:hypothetical protein [Limnohabitans sp. Rim47]